jgi:hypothetical protein
VTIHQVEEFFMPDQVGISEAAKKKAVVAPASSNATIKDQADAATVPISATLVHKGAFRGPGNVNLNNPTTNSKWRL